MVTRNRRIPMLCAAIAAVSILSLTSFGVSDSQASTNYVDRFQAICSCHRDGHTDKDWKGRIYYDRAFAVHEAELHNKAEGHCARIETVARY